jgi:CHAT domain-containing protein
METVCLNNIGYSHLKLKNYTEAKDHLGRAITMMRKEGYERLDGYATHNLGLVHYAQKDYPAALKNYDYALALYRKTGDRRPEAFVYDSYGEIHRDLGQYDKAIEYFQKAIVLAREIRYSEIEAQALGNMMTLWSRRKQPRLAVLYGKQAVNVYQSIRATNRSAEKSAQKTFVQSNEKTYRSLANVLIDQGRLAEAQQVLDLLKAEEYFEFVRRDSSEADEHASLALSEGERKALEEYSKVSANLTSLGARFQTLQEKRNKSGGKLPEAEEAEYVQLKAQVEAAGEGLRTFFTKLASEFSKKVEDGTVVTPQSIETLKADLRRAGTDVVLVSTYLLPDRYRAIVTTGRTMVDRKVEYASIKLTGGDINRKIFEFQSALQNPNTDPRKLGKELYDIFVKPLEADLGAAGAKTILWSLDGSLRYIPMAALSPDGKTYLAEKYQNVVVTLGRQTNLFTKPSGDEWRAIGAGVSKPHAGFSPLPSVPAEIGSIVRDENASSGVLDGTRMLDEQFDLESLRITVPQQTEDGKPFNVLHLATHFSLGGSDQDSALLLGDGTRLSLFDIGRDEALDFKDVELLTLSACQTGVSAGDGSGREVESLGMIAQKKGAKAVLATLWKVADESTSLFMAEFYRLKHADKTMNKAEAIRLAQKAMIDGRIKSSGNSNACRSDALVLGGKKDQFKCDPNAPYSHPYFWSPFVLIGNWR